MHIASEHVRISQSRELIIVCYKLKDDHRSDFLHILFVGGEHADAAAVHEQHGLRSAPGPSGELVSHDEAAPSADTNSAAAADVAVPCFSVPAEAGRHAAGSVVRHAYAAADDGHGSSHGDAAADGALLRAVPGRRRQPAATAAQADLASLLVSLSQLDALLIYTKVYIELGCC